MDNIEEIKDRIDIVDLVSESVQLRHSGKNYTGFCPFHDNKRTPAFAVFPETGTWRCFGQCNEGGDIFKFVMKKEGWDFSEALRYLAERAGVQLRRKSPEEQKQAEEYERLRELLEDAVTFYQHQLHNTTEGRAALEYLHQRDLDSATIETWNLGYAPDSWDATFTYFKSRNYTEADLVAVGLVSQRDSGGIYDRFRHRIIFPIRDERGRMAGFGARILDPDDMPKFINSPQTVLFDKGRLLYGLDKASKTIRSMDQVVVVEGYLDVIALHQHGFQNAVSPMGTALTEYQLKLVKRRTRRIVLALDADAAGEKATLRGLQIARQTLDREQEIAFDSRGWLKQEARLQADIRIATLPEGLDPDDVVNQDPQKWTKILEDANPIVIHVMETLASHRDLDDPKTKTEIANQILPLIEDVPSSIERETYRQRLARMLRVDERALIESHRSRAVRSRPRPRKHLPSRTTISSKSSTAPFAGAPFLEAYCLGILLRHPNLIYRVDRALQKSGLNRLSSQDFQDAGYQALMKLIQVSLDQDFSDPLQVLLGSMPLSLMELADSLLARTENLDVSEDRVLEDLLRAFLDLRRRNVNQSIDHLRFLMEDAQREGELIVSHYQRTMLQHTYTLGRLDTALQGCNDRSIFFD